MSVFRHVAALVLALSASAASADEIIDYTYNARGGLKKVVRSGTVNTGNSSCYDLDKAENRAKVVSTIGADCEAPQVSFSIASNGPVTEGTGSVFTVTKTGTAASSLSVNYATANGSAIAPGDYTAKSGTLTFTTAQTSQTVTVTTVDDTTTEAAEAFTMSLSAPTGGATVATGTATATLNDNDGGGSGGTCASVSFSVANRTVVEGNPLVFTVTKSGSTSTSCTVNYATANGTALAGTDYVSKSGTLTFTSTAMQATVSVTTYDNDRPLGSRTMYLNITMPSGATAQATGTITASGSSCPTCLTSSATSEEPLPDTASEPADEGTSTETTDPPLPPPE